MRSTILPSRLRTWLGDRSRLYGKVLVALCLNVPFLVAALSRYPENVGWASFRGLYAGLVFIGYYVSILLVLLTCLFLLTAAWRRLFLGASAVVLTLALYFLLVDGVVYRVLRTHIDAFWLTYLATTFGGLGISARAVLKALALLGATAALEWWLFQLAARVRRRRLLALGLVAGCVLSLAASQVLHIAAYEADDTRITSLTPELPFYYPLTSHRTAVKYAGLLPLIEEADDAGSDDDARSLRYPLRPVRCIVPAGHPRPNILVLLLESWRADAMDPVLTPHLYAFSRRSSVFLDHFSSGNATPTGVFPLFYGIHSTYWAAVKANSAAIHNPVLIDVLEANGYAFGIYAKSEFRRHKIESTVFRGIDVHESFQGKTADVWDRDMTDQLFAFVESQHRAARPFFGFAFYKSTHYSYDYPATSAPFQPSRELDVMRADGKDDPTPVRNDYRNAVHYVDELVGGLLGRMERAGILDNTIVIVTGDHGEEFNDDGSNYWGHTGNFTRYQTQVPLIVYVPGKAPRRVAAATSEVDIAPTLLQEGLGCRQPAGDYSNGLNLFGPLRDRRPIVVSSYVNHALIIGDDVFAVFPMFVARYKLDDIDARAGSPPPDLLRQALDEMRRFYARPQPAG